MSTSHVTPYDSIFDISKFTKLNTVQKFSLQKNNQGLHIASRINTVKSYIIDAVVRVNEMIIYDAKELFYKKGKPITTTTM